MAYIDKINVELSLTKELLSLFDEVDIYSILPDIYNDGCSQAIRIGDREYITSAAKIKRKFLYDHPHLKSIMYQGQYIRNEEEDYTHMKIVKQYDWEAVIYDRTLEVLLEYVSKIYNIISTVYREYRGIPPELKVINTLCLYKRFQKDTLTPDEKLYSYMLENDIHAIFVVGIGSPLPDGIPHDERRPDYDDHELNGDLYVIHQDKLLELMSCGIRVDRDSLLRQYPEVIESNSDYHSSILNREFPHTIGGGLGKDRVLMWIMNLSDIRDLYYRI